MLIQGVCHALGKLHTWVLVFFKSPSRNSISSSPNALCFSLPSLLNVEQRGLGSICLKLGSNVLRVARLGVRSKEMI